MMILKRELASFALPPAVMVVVVTIAAVIVGVMLYRLIEAPFMALRDRWFPSNFSGAQHTSNAVLRVQLQSHNN
jgi:peptidoglycan/LPS O-acetylase OafA/YrhL